MSYIETLFQFGNYKFPLKYIKMDTYVVNPNQRQDLDAYTDASGVTHRNALAHTKSMVKFTTRQMTESDFESIMSNVRSNYTHKNERDATCKYYDPEYNKTGSGHFYLDPSLSIKIINMFNDGKNGKAGTIRLIGEIEWTFIEY